MTLKERWTLIKDSVVEFLQEAPMAHGAALAYYALLALVPLLYLSVTYFGMVLGQKEMTNIISTVIEQYIGLKDISGVIGLLDQVSFEKGSLLLQIIGIVALLFSCAAIFSSLKRSLNEFYDVEVPKLGRKKMILSTIVSKLISMLFVVGATLILLVLYFGDVSFNILANLLSEYNDLLLVFLISDGLLSTDSVCNSVTVDCNPSRRISDNSSLITSRTAILSAFTSVFESI